MSWSRLLPFSVAASIVLAGCYMPRVDFDRRYHPSDADLAVTRIVHGSLVLSHRGTTVLIDPWYSRTPPLGTTASAGLSLGNLPAIDAIVLTDGGKTHFDPETLGHFLKKGIPAVVPGALAARTTALGFENVTGLAWWKSTRVGDVTLTAVPSANGTDAAGWVVDAHGVQTYVAGATTFDPVLFSAIAQAFPGLDVAILPIGGARYGGVLQYMNPEQAAEAVEILEPDRVIPYHYELVGPLPLVVIRPKAVEDFEEAVARRLDETDDRTVVLEPGASWHHYRPDASPSK